ncbi:MAG: ComF family protein [Christensenellales bacterium]
MTMGQKVLDLLIPQVRCLGCNEPRRIDPGAALCDACVAALQGLRIGEGICPRCLSPRRGSSPCSYCLRGGMQGLDAAYGAFIYHGPAQALVSALKFQGVYLASEPLIQGMRDCLDGRPFDALVPVPLHRGRLRERGFNQARLLCEGISRGTGIPCLDALERLRRTKRQSSLPHGERQGNVKGSFRCVLPVRGLSILLVDDVRTTGSTARASASELKQAGAREVCLLTATVAAAYSSPSSDTV